MQEELIREIVIEIAELEKEFNKRITALYRKLKIALGDVKPAPVITQFTRRDGTTRTIKKGGKK
jgi:hypothetical protein